MPARFERAPEAALVKHPEEGRGLDPQWETTQSLSKRCRSPDRLTFGIWRMAEQSKPMPYGTIGIQSRAGEPCRFTIPVSLPDRSRTYVLDLRGVALIH